MPLVRFETNADEGFYLLVTSGHAGFFPNKVYGVTEHLLRQRDAVFREKNIRYHQLSQAEADRLVKHVKL